MSMVSTLRFTRRRVVSPALLNADVSSRRRVPLARRRARAPRSRSSAPLTVSRSIYGVDLRTFEAAFQEQDPSMPPSTAPLTEKSGSHVPYQYTVGELVKSG